MPLDIVPLSITHKLLKRQGGLPTTSTTEPPSTIIPSPLPTSSTTTPPTIPPSSPTPPASTPPPSTPTNPSQGPGGGGGGGPGQGGSTPNVPSVSTPSNSGLSSVANSNSGSPSVSTTVPVNTPTTPLSTTNTPTNPPGALPVTTSTTTVTSTGTAGPIAPVTADASNSSPKGFFHNTGAVAGVFSVAGVAVLILAFFIISTAIRRRRARALDREVAEAAAHAQSIDPNALDDDSYGSSGGGPAAGGGLAYSKSLSSHGTMRQEPMNPDRGMESYGMADLGAGAGLAGLGGYRGVAAAGPSGGPADDYYYRSPDGGYGAARFVAGGVGAGHTQQQQHPQGGYGYGGGYEGAYADYPAQGQQGYGALAHQGYDRQAYDQQAYDQQAYEYQGQPPQAPSQGYYAAAPPGAGVPTDDPFRSQTHLNAGNNSPPPLPRTSTTDELGPLSTAFRSGGTDEDGHGGAYGGGGQGYAYGGEEDEHGMGQAMRGREREDDDEGSVNEDAYGQRRVLKVANAD